MNCNAGAWTVWWWCSAWATPTVLAASSLSKTAHLVLFSVKLDLRFWIGHCYFNFSDVVLGLFSHCRTFVIMLFKGESSQKSKRFKCLGSTSPQIQHSDWNLQNIIALLNEKGLWFVAAVQFGVCFGSLGIGVASESAFSYPFVDFGVVRGRSFVSVQVAEREVVRGRFSESSGSF